MTQNAMVVRLRHLWKETDEGLRLEIADGVYFALVPSEMEHHFVPVLVDQPRFVEKYSLLSLKGMKLLDALALVERVILNIFNSRKFADVATRQLPSCRDVGGEEGKIVSIRKYGDNYVSTYTCKWLERPLDITGPYSSPFGAHDAADEIMAKIVRFVKDKSHITEVVDEEIEDKIVPGVTTAPVIPNRTPKYDWENGEYGPQLRFSWGVVRVVGYRNDCMVDQADMDDASSFVGLYSRYNKHDTTEITPMYRRKYEAILAVEKWINQVTHDHATIPQPWEEGDGEL